MPELEKRIDDLCRWCFGTVAKNAENYPYCCRQCFDAHVKQAVEPKQCNLKKRIEQLRDDAETRVSNIDANGWGIKLLPTKNYFQSRADVLNDLLVMMDADTECSCGLHLS